MNIDEAMRDLAQTMLSSRLKQYRDWVESPAYKRWKAESDAAWAAKPWHERARIRWSARVHRWRVRLGEKIAGREFDY